MSTISIAAVATSAATQNNGGVRDSPPFKSEGTRSSESSKGFKSNTVASFLSSISEIGHPTAAYCNTNNLIMNLK